jgi:3-hydroxybutyryl-CoA dehydrogenase
VALDQSLRRAIGGRRRQAAPVIPRLQIDEVRRVVIVGSGTMGQQIGFQCAGHGFDVVLYDIAPAALESAQVRIEAYAEELLADGVITAPL